MTNDNSSHRRNVGDIWRWRKKRWWTHCHRDPSSRGEKKRYYSTEVTLTKHRNSNSNSQVGIIRQSLGLNRQGTLNATVCSLSRAVVRWVFLMIRNSFNLYQLFSQSFILILEEGGKISGVFLGLSYKNNLRLTCLILRGLYPNRSDLQLVFAIQCDSKSQTYNVQFTGICHELLDIEDKLLNYSARTWNKDARPYFFRWKFQSFNIYSLRNLFSATNLIQ